MQLNRFAIVLACSVSAALGQGTDWPTYGGDLASSKYRALDQINAGNFSQLEIAWRFKTDNIGNRPEFKLEGTPLMVKGVVYATAGSRRAAIALDAATGEQLSRVPKGFCSTDPAAGLLRFKSFILYTELPPGLATTPALFTEVFRRFRVMKPFLDFLTAPQRKAPARLPGVW